MIGFDLTDEQLQLQKQMRAFAREEIAPFAAEIDRRPDNLFDFNVIRRIAKANLLSLNVPTEYGGKGMTPLNAVIIAEELGAACLGTTMIGGGTWLATTCINLVGTEEQKKRYLPLVCGENAQLAAFAATEPESGSDIASIKTLAVRKGDHYILNGFKTHITNAGTAGFYVVLATTNPGSRHRGLNAFIVDGDARGLSLSATEDLMGLRVCQNGSLTLKDVHVPADNLLGAENTGFLIAMQTLDISRPCLGAAAVGLARSAFEIALTHAHERRQFGRPLIDNQSISFMLADMATTIETARLLTWKAAWLVEQGMDSTKTSSMCKVFTSEMAEKICSQAIQVLGAKGYSRKYPLEKYYRDAKALQIFEGPSQIQRHIISTML